MKNFHSAVARTTTFIYLHSTPKKTYKVCPHRLKSRTFIQVFTCFPEQKRRQSANNQHALQSPVFTSPPIGKRPPRRPSDAGDFFLLDPPPFGCVKKSIKHEARKYEKEEGKHGKGTKIDAVSWQYIISSTSAAASPYKSMFYIARWTKHESV